MNISGKLKKGFFVTYEGKKVVKQGKYEGYISTPLDLKVFKTEEEMKAFISSLTGNTPSPVAKTGDKIQS